MDRFDALCFRQLVIKQLILFELAFFYKRNQYHRPVNTGFKCIPLAMRNVNKCVSPEIMNKNQIIINTHKNRKGRENINQTKKKTNRATNRLTQDRHIAISLCHLLAIYINANE